MGPFGARLSLGAASQDIRPLLCVVSKVCHETSRRNLGDLSDETHPHILEIRVK